MSIFNQVTFKILFAVAHYLAAPVLLIWVWLRWLKLPILRTAPSLLSLIGFVLATVSGLLAVSTVAYAQIHRFPFTIRCYFAYFVGSLAVDWRTSVWLGWCLATEFTAMARPGIWLCDAHLLDRCRIRRIDEGD